MKRFASALEAATFTEADLGAYCGEKDLHQEQVKSWNTACIKGNQSNTEQKACEIIRLSLRTLQRWQQGNIILAYEEVYLASESSFYRILKVENMLYHRGRAKTKGSHKKPNQ